MGLALASLLLVGCRSEATRPAVEPGYGEPSELVAWVEATPRQFRAGEVVQIEVGLRNPTKRPIVMGFTSGCMLEYRVTSPEQGIVSPIRPCPQNAPTLEIEPGRSLVVRGSWDGSQYSGAPAPPGLYHVKIGGYIVPPAPPSVTIELLAPTE
jgi:hypothetical protein